MFAEELPYSEDEADERARALRFLALSNLPNLLFCRPVAEAVVRGKGRGLNLQARMRATRMAPFAFEMRRWQVQTMSHVIMATYSGGMLMPDERLEMPPGTRVRLVVEPLEEQVAPDQELWDEFDRACNEAIIDSGGVHLTRDQLHER